MEEERIIQVEAFYNGRLSKDDQQQFMRDLEEDPALKRVFEEYELCLSVIDRQVEKELRSKFDTWRAPQKESKTRTLFVMMSIAASLLLLISFYFIFVSSKPNTADQLAYDVYTLPKSPGSTMGEGDQHWLQGKEAYNNKDFHRAISEWSAIKNPTPEETYYLAHSYFNIRDYAKAEALFRQVALGTSVYNYPADWYLTLSYLALNKKDEFKKQLDKIIVDKDHPYNSEARELIRKMQ